MSAPASAPITAMDVEHCDGCGAGITQGYLVPTGRYDLGLDAPIVRLVCPDCWARSK